MWVFLKLYKAAGEERAMTPRPLTSLCASVASDHFSTTASPGTHMSKLRRGGAGPDTALFGVST